MKHIWAPWRVAYVRAPKPKGCILCDKPAEKEDAENYILYRGKLNFVMLNAYPYTAGHLMVIPYRHIASLEEMTAAERHEHFDIVSQCLKALREEFKPEGFNIGINMGKVAGAGIEDHVHSHIVPRWNGDTNFITTIADVRVVPEALADTYRKLKERF
jgi:ATP adenylyltransferase